MSKLLLLRKEKTNFEQNFNDNSANGQSNSNANVPSKSEGMNFD